MEKIAGKLTVFFDNPFWVGVFECVEKNKLSVCRVVLGAEPKDYEVYDFILKLIFNHICRCLSLTKQQCKSKKYFLNGGYLFSIHFRSIMI